MPRPAREAEPRDAAGAVHPAAGHVDGFLNSLIRPWLLVGLFGTVVVELQGGAGGQPLGHSWPLAVIWLLGVASLATRRIGSQGRARLLIALLFLVGVLGLFFAPLLPGGMVFCGSAVLVAGIVFGRRGLAATLLPSGIAFVLAAVSWASGFRLSPEVVSADPTDPLTWARVGSMSVLPLATVAMGVVSILRGYRQALAMADASGSRYRALFDGSADAVLILRQGQFVECNREAVAMFGYPEQELLGRPPSDLSPERQPDGTLSTEKSQQLAAAAMAGATQRFPWRHRRCDGTDFDVDVTLNRLALDGETCLLAIVRDVSERLRAEEALRASEERYRSIVETTSEWVWELDLEGHHTYTNPAVEEILGHRADEIVGRDCFSLIHPEDRPIAQQLVAAGLSSGRGWRGQIIRWRHKRGHYRTLESNADLALDASGRPAGFRGSDRDVTERMDAQEALRQSEERYRIVSELTSDFAYAFKVAAGGTLEVQWVTDAVTRITGYSKKDLADEWRNLIHPGDLPIAQHQLEVLREGRASTAEFRIVRQDGASAWVRNYATPFWSASEQRTVRIFGAIKDTTAQHAAETEQRRLAQELRQLHTRLETIRTEESRRMARRVHDDLGQPLTALQFDLVRLRRECGEEAGERRERLGAASRLLAETLETVRGISQELHPRILDDLGLPAAIAAHARALCTRAGLAWHVNVVPDDLAVDRRRAEILYRVYREAITNVVRHAGAGSIHVSLRAQVDAIELAVEDDGEGMSDPTADNPRSLGLLYMRESTRALEGTCEITTRPGHGTMVTVRIPLVDSMGSTLAGDG